MKRSAPTIVVTRDEGPEGPLATALARRGARVLRMPTIAIEAPSDWRPLDRALAAPGGYDWVLFTSASAVDAVCARPAWTAAQPELPARDGSRSSSRRGRIAVAGARAVGRLRKLGPQAPLRRWRIAAVGAKTAGRLRVLGVDVDLVPGVPGAAGLAKALIDRSLRNAELDRSGRAPRAVSSTRRSHRERSHPQPLAGARILWPRSEIASRDLAETLERAGAKVTDPVAYRTLPSFERPRAIRTSHPQQEARGGNGRARELVRRLEAGEIDGIAFMSPSSARGLAAVLGSEDLSMLAGRVAIASIGPTTSAALASLGAPADVESAARSADALAEALIGWLDGRQEVPR